MKGSRARIYGALFLLLVIASVTAALLRNDIRRAVQTGMISRPALTKQDLAKALGGPDQFRNFPSELDLPVSGKPTRLVLQYSFDAELQNSIQHLFESYTPDYGALVVLDPATGRVLAMSSYTRSGDQSLGNLTLRSSFPAASIFKVVTAAAAIAEKNFSVDTVIPFNGRNHTLYRSAILKDRVTRWTRYMTLRDAFAHSVNTVFGKIGARSLGAYELREYANRFGFNRQIASDVLIGEGRATIEDDPWMLAEAASGYTRDNRMSPLQGALIAAAVANDGIMMEPYVVQSAHAPDGQMVYEVQPKVAGIAVDKETAAEIRELMRETVTHGTSRKSFRGFFRGPFADFSVGGKTGSLTGDDPPGKYDWFVGYAEHGQRRVAVAAVTVHQKLWRVKSSYLARRAIENYFRDRAGSLAAANRLLYSR